MLQGGLFKFPFLKVLIKLFSMSYENSFRSVFGYQCRCLITPTLRARLYTKESISKVGLNSKRVLESNEKRKIIFQEFVWERNGRKWKKATVLGQSTNVGKFSYKELKKSKIYTQISPLFLTAYFYF